MNKVRYGLSKVHVAELIEKDGVVTFGVPKAIKGAVNLTLDPEGSQNPFRADNMDYFISSSNKGYTGELEMALIPDWYLEEYQGHMRSDKGELIEIANTSMKPHALLFQFEGDEKAIRHTLYKVISGRPSKEASTTDDGDEPQTETMPITATPLDSNGYYVVKSKTTEDTPQDEYDKYFTTAPVLPTFTAKPDPEVQG